jgi:hypothetical protein
MNQPPRRLCIVGVGVYIHTAHRDAEARAVPPLYCLQVMRQGNSVHGLQAGQPGFKSRATASGPAVERTKLYIPFSCCRGISSRSNVTFKPCPYLFVLYLRFNVVCHSEVCTETLDFVLVLGKFFFLLHV